MEDDSSNSHKSIKKFMKALNILNDKRFIVFSTRNFAHHFNMSLSSASHKLLRMEQNQGITHIAKGIWANLHHPYYSPLSAIPYLLRNEQGYISFLTALNIHGIVSQIPQKYQVATTGHSRDLTTPIGHFEFHQMHPRLMRTGIEWSKTHCPYRIATAEKALLDTLYLATRKNNKFLYLPELDLSKKIFDSKKLKKMLRMISYEKIRTAIENRFDQLSHKEIK